MDTLRTRERLAYVVRFQKSDGTLSYRGCETPGGEMALLCYPSPFDAVIDASGSPAALEDPEQLVQVHAVDELRLGAATPPHIAPGLACLHLAWRACSGSLLLRPDGTPDTVLFTFPELESGNTVRALPDPAVRLLDEIHELAGLFAWRETNATFENWSEPDLSALAQHAWQQVPTVEANSAEPDFDQLALYDPEFRQWHFLPAAGLMDRCSPE